MRKKLLNIVVLSTSIGIAFVLGVRYSTGTGNSARGSVIKCAAPNSSSDSAFWRLMQNMEASLWCNSGRVGYRVDWDTKAERFLENGQRLDKDALEYPASNEPRTYDFQTRWDAVKQQFTFEANHEEVLPRYQFADSGTVNSFNSRMDAVRSPIGFPR